MDLFKNFLNNPKKNENVEIQEPQIGFKLIFNKKTSEIYVKIIGGKMLTKNYGNTKPQGYLVKVTMFPNKEKFETKIVDTSWPTFDEEFKFKITNSKYDYGNLKGKFLSFTVYAILFDEINKNKDTGNFFDRFINLASGSNNGRKKQQRKGLRHSLNNRRTVGSITYNLEPNNFMIKIGDEIFSTPEIWRELKDISSGVAENSKDNKKGNVEVTMLYSLSEDGNNDLIEISVTKLRCNVQTMEEHEKLGGKLYLKISAYEKDDVIQKIKSDKFDPTISLKLEKSTAKLKINVNDYNKKQIKIIIKLMCKPLMSNKIELGKINIDNKSELLKEIITTPMIPVTKILNF